ncbi:hypothetical protein EXN22_16340 [Pseudomonas tructae]|uniref:Uncharacterized protein n=1 Tax=Pseudomonas tructae TaxID=2518644 RepID=A0A411MK44_9PSED|nr:hypothetical protein [Pseudomonas tructae]QBF27184.1 hypothetical protein EXN22_16340 [Pseudomonas tructae]
MNVKADALEILEDRFTKLASGPSDQLYGEVDMAIEMCGLLGFISFSERSHFQLRRDRIKQRDVDEFLLREGLLP